MKIIHDEKLKELKLQGFSNRECARQLGVDESSIRSKLKTLAKHGWTPEYNNVPEVPPGQEIRGLSTLKRLDRYAQQDMYDAFGKLICKKGDLLHKGESVLQWVKTSKEKELQNQLLKEMIEGLKEKLPKYPAIKLDKKVSPNEDLMAVFPIGDLHIGMLAWKEECGNDWSLKHVEVAVQLAFTDLVEKCPSCDLAVLINQGDFAHRDTRHAVTPNSGHPLDVDSRYPKMFRMCLRLERFLIELLLKKFKKLIVINVSGNHDPCLTTALSECMSVVYENNDRVIVDVKPRPVHYVEFGKVMIAATHGDTIKMNKLKDVVAHEQSEMWGRTKFRYGLTGHIHSENKQEYPGMVVESFRTLAAADSFATWYGWRSGRDTRAIIYHKELGKQVSYITPIEMFQEILENIDGVG